jgi:hypothetical protein
MSLAKKISDDLIVAMKARDERRTATLRLARAAIGHAEAIKAAALTEEEILEILNREAKKRREAIEEFSKVNRSDRVQQEQAELNILLEYLPKQMGREELEKLVREAIAAVNATDAKQMGAVMGKLMPLVKGKADGKLVNQIVQELLAEKK